MLVCLIVLSFSPSRELLVAGSFLVLAFLFLAILLVVSYFRGFAASRDTNVNRRSGARCQMHRIGRYAHK